MTNVSVARKRKEESFAFFRLIFQSHQLSQNNTVHYWRLHTHKIKRRAARVTDTMTHAMNAFHAKNANSWDLDLDISLRQELFLLMA